MSALLAACSRRTDSFSSEEEVFSVFYSCAGRRCTGENRIRFPNMEHVCTLKRSKAFTNTWPGFASTPQQQQLLVQWKQSGCSLLAAADPPRVWQTFSLQRSFQALPKRSANFTNNSWFGFSEQSACLYFYTALYTALYQLLTWIILSKQKHSRGRLFRHTLAEYSAQSFYWATSPWRKASVQLSSPLWPVFFHFLSIFHQQLPVTH